MPIRDWTTRYPTDIDRESVEMPDVANGVSFTRESQLNTVGAVLRTLETEIGATTPAGGSLRKRVADLEAETLAFLDLTDTPANYTGAGSKLVAVNAGANALEFVSAPTGTFVGLTDTPANYTGAGSKLVAVNAGANALEFVAAPAPGGGGPSLVFADDTQFSEAGTSFVTKKTFRIVKDSGNPPASWRVVVGISIVGGNGDTVECKVDIGGDSVTLTSTSTSEEIKAGDIVITAGNNTPLTAVVQIKVTGAGGDTAYVKYTDIYAVY